MPWDFRAALKEYQSIAQPFTVTLSIVAGALLLIWGDELPGGTRKRDAPAPPMLETLGLRLTVNNLMRVVGPALFGFIASALGLFPVFCINALLMGIGGLLSHPKHRD